MMSVFLTSHITFNIAYVLACQRKQIHLLHSGFCTLTIRPLCFEKNLSIIALELYFDVVSTDEEEVVPSKLKSLQNRQTM